MIDGNMRLTDKRMRPDNKSDSIFCKDRRPRLHVLDFEKFSIGGDKLGKTRADKRGYKRPAPAQYGSERRETRTRMNVYSDSDKYVYVYIIIIKLN